ncbi:anthranilate phosphoribosyltransferase [Micromonospora tulbaghiae]|uniref:Anthranilate phosphoribosyltransferase n=1 Tax=Micromonospora tulbaghiae TaxID=479978 RepID=A0AAW4JQV8_9ACTN|nr:MULTISPECIES: anthranilate phosphoribosyltransferase [Micromonospora]KAB1907312.1 anthranilate phosphoribosyltransferase [Micromonospora sp. AMSO1212t]MBO4141356.1 anthranilate phosphoribosyltransferase [Micromonospora tulbaghiae]MDX5457686.1 anthranilate phosphoribosyltransferase [Micromonospora tulbaghiae]SCE89090.1 anthranilate phosphoribosyltransferase [Micromonospora tulbaghiae]
MGERTWPLLLNALLRGEELSTADTAWAMGEIMAGSATPAQIAGFAVALRTKGETPAELGGLVEAMLTRAVPVHLPEDVRATALDVVGTGGDLAHTVNISTMAALVVAGAGVRVVKHGNRAASSSCGTADVLEQLGVPLDLAPEQVARCVTEAGIGFCFAARFHPGMRHTGPVRREIGVPTAFNFLGPLTNPARPRAGAVGCFDKRMAPVMAAVFAARGDSAIVVRGEDGLDEFSTGAPTRIWVAQQGTVTEAVLDATELGVPRATLADLRGGDAVYNADVVRRLLAGETGPVRDAVLVNAAVALATQGPLDGDLYEVLRANLDRAAEAVDSGGAAAALERWLEVARAA